MRRRELIALIGTSVTWPSLRWGRSRGGRTGSVAYLPGVFRRYTTLFEPARRHGFIEGQNLTVDYRDFTQHVDLLSSGRYELVKARVDVIATAGDLPIRAAQEATKTIPILAMTDDMLGGGISEFPGAA